MNKNKEPFFAVRHGSTRTVFLIGSLAIKIPCFWVIKCFFQRNPRRSFLWKALVANLTERATWDLTRATFLAPTYLSLGIVNVMRRAYGSPASRDTIKINLDLFGVPCDPNVLGIDGHSFYADGDWLYTGNGYLLTDYGDCYSHGRPISEFIKAKQANLERALGPRVSNPG